MRDAMGGSVALVIIVVFIVIALGYMAFNVNYTKAFRMKNKIISVYEKYEGKCEENCEKEIKDYADTIGYSMGDGLTCADDYELSKYNLYCSKKISVNYGDESKDIIHDLKPKVYYRIITKINIEIPIINNMLDLKFFYITGDTKSFYVKKSS